MKLIKQILKKINMNIVNKYNEIWNIVEKENEKLFLYFLNKKLN